MERTRTVRKAVIPVAGNGVEQCAPEEASQYGIGGEVYQSIRALMMSHEGRILAA